MLKKYFRVAVNLRAAAIFSIALGVAFFAAACGSKTEKERRRRWMLPTDLIGTRLFLREA